MITSPANAKIKALRALHERQGRLEGGAYLCEGIRLVEEALAAGIQPRLVLTCPSQLAATPRGAALLQRIATLPAASREEVSERALAAAAATVTPQGVVAALPLPRTPHPSADAALILLLDGLQDPGNLGTILRTALASGADSVVTSPSSADPYSPKVVRAAMGAHFYLALLPAAPWSEIRSLADGRQVLLAVPKGGAPFDRVDWCRPTLLVVGSEAAGPGPEAEGLATGEVSIPIARQVESLNAAVAAGVLLIEAYRQRIGRRERIE